MATRAEIIKRAITLVAAQSTFKLTKSNFFVESNALVGFLGEHFLGVEEDTLLLLEGLLGLSLCMLRMICHLC